MNKIRLTFIVLISSLAVAVSKSISLIGETVSIKDFLIIFFSGIGVGIFIKLFIDKQKEK